MVLLTTIMILLHGPDGHEILVNPRQITSMRAAKPGEERKHFTESVRCMVGLTDGKFVTVVEPCEAVSKIVEDTK